MTRTNPGPSHPHPSSSPAAASYRRSDPARRGARTLALSMPGVRAFAWPVVFGVLAAFSAVALLAMSANLITRASLEWHILLLNTPIVAVRAFAIGRASFRYVERLTGHNAALAQLARLRANVLERLIPVAPAGLRGTTRGDLLARLVSDVDDLQFFPLRVVLPGVASTVVAFAAVATVWFLSPLAGLALLLALVVSAAVAVLLGARIAGRAEREVAPLRGRLDDLLHELVDHLEVLEANDALDSHLERVREADARLRRALTAGSLAEGATAAVMTLASGVAVVAAVLFGAAPVADGDLAPALFAVTALAPIALFEVWQQVPNAVSAWRRARAAARRVDEVVPDEVPAEIPVSRAASVAAAASASAGGSGAHRAAVGPTAHGAAGDGVLENGTDADGGRPATGVAEGAGVERWQDRAGTADGDEGKAVEHGSAADGGASTAGPVARAVSDARVSDPSDSSIVGVRLRDVEASWPGGSGVALRLPRLEAGPGDRILVSGDSGAGKSTLANVLVRFLDHRGDYSLVDAAGRSVDAHDVDPEEVRRFVGLVEQRPHLFGNSIRQNLLFAKPDASDAELEAALDRVGLADWMGERGGLDARVGERGRLVSGGQAQRVALARGILADFPVLVLDEPTANVDPGRAERLMRDLLAASGPERAVIVISHTPVEPALVTGRVRLEAPGA